MRGARRIVVLGVGNVLMSDEGIGPFVLKILESRYEFPPNVVLRDLGAPGLGLDPFSPIMTRLCWWMP
jgi:hydrogenase maturation protease